VLPLLAVSSIELVDALAVAGFVVTAESETSTTLRCGLRSVEVTDAAVLTCEALETALRDAGLTYTEFLDLLAETPTQPQLSVTDTGVRPRRKVMETG
jgi:hypothetical protein